MSGEIPTIGRRRSMLKGRRGWEIRVFQSCNSYHGLHTLQLSPQHTHISLSLLQETELSINKIKSKP